MLINNLNWDEQTHARQLFFCILFLLPAKQSTSTNYGTSGTRIYTRTSHTFANTFKYNDYWILKLCVDLNIWCFHFCWCGFQYVGAARLNEQTVSYISYVLLNVCIHVCLAYRNVMAIVYYDCIFDYCLVLRHRCISEKSHQSLSILVSAWFLDGSRLVISKSVRACDEIHQNYDHTFHKCSSLFGV